MRTREELWRRFAPPGQENAFAETAARYQARANFGAQVTDKIVEEVTNEHRIDKAARTAARMNYARIGKIFLRACRRTLTGLAIESIPEAYEILTDDLRNEP